MWIHLYKKMLLVLPLLLLWHANSLAQHTVSGTVTDAETSASLPGVNIVIKGTTQGTATDVNGEYNLTVFSPNDTLIFSFIGFQRREIPINGREVINIELQEAASELEEVVVVGYGEQTKVSVVGSQVTVEPEDLQTAPVRNLSTTLAGKLAGIVSVQRSGEPGQDGAEIWIRGISTFDQNLSHPLVLVDGVPRSFADIVPEDIASFSILKDASATAVYGVRGANGVILIKTKKGRAGKPRVKLRYNEGVTAFTRLPDFAGGTTYMRMTNEALTTRGSAPLYSEEEIEATRNQTDPALNPDVDWYEEVFRDQGQSRQANLQISGGSDMAVYYVSAGYFEEVGLFRTDELASYNSQISNKRYNMTTNLTLYPTNTTEIQLGIQGYLSQGNFPGSSGNVIYNNVYRTTPVIHPPKYADGKIANVPGGVLFNPYALLTQRGYITNARNQLYSNIRVTQDLDFLIEGLTFTSMFAYDAYNFISERRNKEPDTYLATGRDATTDSLIFQQTDIGQEFLNFSHYTEGNRSIYTESSLRYNTDFGPHSVGAMLLYNQSDRSNIYSDNFNFISSLPFRYRGLAGRATYSYDNRYFLEFNFGYNGSENFAPEKRYGLFPSIGAGWVPSNERFFQPLEDVIQFLKFRFSYGIVGSSDIAGNSSDPDDPGRRFAYLATVDNPAGYTYGESMGNVIGGRAIGEYASDVTWETSEKINIGLDLWTLNHSLNLQIDVFKEHRTGIFLRRSSLPWFAGITNPPYGNVGIIDNKGFDGSLKYSGNIGDVRLQVLGNVNFNRNKVIEDDLPPWEFPWLEHKGRKVGQRFGYVALGLFESEEEIANSPAQVGDVRPGDIKFKDISGDGRIDADDRYPIGYGSIPEWTYGFGFTVGYKAFTLSTFFQGVGNVDIYLNGEGFQPFAQGTSRGNLYSNIEDRWTPENPDPDAFYPRLMVGSLNENYNLSTWWLRNGRYLRLKNAQLTFSLPSEWLQKAHIRSASIFLAGVNLLTFSPFKLWDVELGSGRGAEYPHIATYSAGIEINF